MSSVLTRLLYNYGLLAGSDPIEPLERFHQVLLQIVPVLLKPTLLLLAQEFKGQYTELMSSAINLSL